MTEKPDFSAETVARFKTYLDERAQLPKGHENHLAYQNVSTYLEGVSAFVEYALREEFESPEELTEDAVELACFKSDIRAGTVTNHTKVKAIFEYLDWLRAQGSEIPVQKKPKLERVGQEKAEATRALNREKKIARMAAARTAAAAAAAPPVAVASSAERVVVLAPHAAAAAPQPRAAAPRAAAPPPPAALRPHMTEPEIQTPIYTAPLSVLSQAEAGAPDPGSFGVLAAPGAAPKPKAGVNPAAHAIPAGGFKIAIYRQVMGVPEPIFVTRTSASNVASVGAIAEFLQRTIVTPRLQEFLNEDVVTFIVKAVNINGVEGEPGTAVPVEVPRALKNRALGFRDGSQLGAGSNGDRGGVTVDGHAFASIHDAAMYFNVTVDSLEQRLRTLSMPRAAAPQEQSGGAGGAASFELRLALNDVLHELRDTKRQVDDRLAKVRDEFLRNEERSSAAQSNGLAELAALSQQPQQIMPPMPPSPMETAMAGLITAQAQKMMEPPGEGPGPLEMIDDVVGMLERLRPTGPSPDIVALQHSVAALAVTVEKALTRPATNATDDFLASFEKYEKFAEKMGGGRRSGELMEGIMGLGMMLMPLGEKAIDVYASRRGAAAAAGDEPKVPEEIAEAVVKCLTGTSTDEIMANYAVVLGYAADDPDVSPYLEKLSESMSKPGGKVLLVLGIVKILHNYGFKATATVQRVERLVRIVTKLAELPAAAPQVRVAPAAAQAAAPHVAAEPTQAAAAPAQAAAKPSQQAPAAQQPTAAQPAPAPVTAEAPPTPADVLAAFDLMKPEDVAATLRAYAEKFRSGASAAPAGAAASQGSGEIEIEDGEEGGEPGGDDDAEGPADDAETDETGTSGGDDNSGGEEPDAEEPDDDENESGAEPGSEPGGAEPGGSGDEALDDVIAAGGAAGGSGANGVAERVAAKRAAAAGL